MASQTRTKVVTPYFFSSWERKESTSALLREKTSQKNQHFSPFQGTKRLHVEGERDKIYKGQKKMRNVWERGRKKIAIIGVKLEL